MLAAVIGGGVSVLGVVGLVGVDGSRGGEAMHVVAVDDDRLAVDEDPSVEDGFADGWNGS
jgi:hypothetical protein